jgi:hypothetical protein
MVAPEPTARATGSRLGVKPTDYRLTQPLEHPLLVGVSERHRRIVALQQRDLGRLGAATADGGVQRPAAFRLPA